MKSTIHDIWSFDGGDLEIDFDTSPFPKNLPGYEIPIDKPYLITIAGNAYVDLAHLMKTQQLNWQALGITVITDADSNQHQH